MLRAWACLTPTCAQEPVERAAECLTCIQAGKTDDVHFGRVRKPMRQCVAHGCRDTIVHNQHQPILAYWQFCKLTWSTAPPATFVEHTSVGEDPHGPSGGVAISWSLLVLQRLSFLSLHWLQGLRLMLRRKCLSVRGFLPAACFVVGLQLMWVVFEQQRCVCACAYVCVCVYLR